LKKIFASGVLMIYLLLICFMTATVDATLLRSFIVNWLDGSHVLHLSKPALILLHENRSGWGSYGMRAKGKLLKTYPGFRCKGCPKKFHNMVLINGSI